ncbi:transcriptional regulator, Fis family [Leptospira broomii serovar Hurstbridge str. 5399]|uniref:Transcriptional regulator, Fis family n=2 Tax=Leptospira broomii TaxID=301541 RepID=T0GMC7_9LEPT|nr:transcriptional regulator, Fis family [Leptospira broomii serovar Hurstbridge str. 5399]
MVDAMLNFKQSPFMEPAIQEIFYGKPTTADLRLLLPLAFPFLLKILGSAAGLATLPAEGEQDALEEVASWGYSEEGFFYSFLAKGSETRKKLESGSPFYLSKSATAEFFLPDSSGGLLGSILVQGKVQGFLLLELENPPSEWQSLFLALFCQKLSSILEDAPSIPIASKGEAGSEDRKDRLGQILFRLSNSGDAVWELYRKLGILKIRGPKGSGKKTLAKWVHRRESAGRGLLVIGVLPEHGGKLEKSLEEWGAMAQGGTLVFERIQEYSALQQKLLYEYATSERSRRPRLIFLENSESSPAEELVFFRALLESNSLEIPAWKTWSTVDRRNAVSLIFEDVREAQGRLDLSLSEEAGRSLATSELDRNLEDLRNSIEEGVLHSSGREIREFAIQSERPQGVSMPEADDLDLRKAVEALERQKILLAYKLFGGNQIRMSKALGISRGSLQYKLKNLGLG